MTAQTMTEVEKIIYLTNQNHFLIKTIVFIITAWIITTIIYAIRLYFIVRKDATLMMNKKEKKIFKALCKLEEKSIPEEVHKIIDMYTEDYTNKHKINWDEYI